MKLNEVIVDGTGSAGVVEFCWASVGLAGVANENEGAEGVDDGFPRPKPNDGFSVAGFSAVDDVNEKLGFGTSSLAGLANENAGAGVSSPCCDPADELALLLSGEGTTIAFNGDDERGL